MPMEVARRGIDMLFAEDPAGGRGRELAFFGGEPLLGFPLIQALVAEVEERSQRESIPVSFHLVTNGTLLTEPIVRFMAEHRFRIAVSLDGDPQAHDANRRFRNGRGSHRAVVAGIQLARSIAPEQWSRAFAVVHPSNAGMLPESFDALLELGLWDMAFNLDVGCAWDRATRGRYGAALRQLGDRYIGAYRQGRKVALNLFDSKIAAAITDHPYGLKRCSFGCLELHVTPAGRLYPCDRVVREDSDDDLVIGDVWSGLDLTRRDAQVTTKNAMDPDCAGCDFRNRCIHWCGCVNHIMTGSVCSITGVARSVVFQLGGSGYVDSLGKRLGLLGVQAVVPAYPQIPTHCRKAWKPFDVRQRVVSDDPEVVSGAYERRYVEGRHRVVVMDGEVVGR